MPVDRRSLRQSFIFTLVSFLGVPDINQNSKMLLPAAGKILQRSPPVSAAFCTLIWCNCDENAGNDRRWDSYELGRRCLTLAICDFGARHVTATIFGTRLALSLAASGYDDRLAETRA